LLRLRASVDELQALLTGHSRPLHDDWYVQREVCLPPVYRASRRCDLRRILGKALANGAHPEECGNFAEP
jgi:hypothetical protein